MTEVTKQQQHEDQRFFWQIKTFSPATRGQRRMKSRPITELKRSRTLCVHGLRHVHQTPLSMRLNRQEYWSGLPFPPPGHLPDPGIEPCLLCLLYWQAGSLPLHHLGSPSRILEKVKFSVSAIQLYQVQGFNWKGLGFWASFLVQRLRICLTMPGTLVQSLI